jgi:cell division protein FtsQ
MSRRAPAGGSELRALVAGITAPADQRFRRPDSRPVRRRTSALLVRVWKPAAVVAAVVAAGAIAAGALLTAPGLAIDRLVVRGQVRMPGAVAEAQLAHLQGRNIFRADLEASRLRLLDLPWVEAASLVRVLPDTIEVRLVERTPIALVRLGQRLHLMDADGVVLAEFGPAYADLDLPIVDGLAGNAPRNGARVDPVRLAVVRRFFDALEPRPDLRARVSQIDVARARDLVLLLTDDAALLHLGQERFVERLQYYLDLVPTLGDQFQDIEYVDLRFEGRLVVQARGDGRAATAGRQ